EPAHGDPGDRPNRARDAAVREGHERVGPCDPVRMFRTSQKTARFPESVIRETTRIAIAHGAVNLGQGFPDFPAPQELKDAAKRAIDADVNQYTITWGTPEFR